MVAGRISSRQRISPECPTRQERRGRAGKCSLQGRNGESIASRLEKAHDTVILLAGRIERLDHGDENELVDLSGPLHRLTRHVGLIC